MTTPSPASPLYPAPRPPAPAVRPSAASRARSRPPRRLPGLPALLLGALVQVSPPAAPVGPPPAELVGRLHLDPFYARYLDAGGLPVLSSARVRPLALVEARFLILRMLAHRPELARELGQAGVRFTVMAFDEWTTDVPEHSDLEPAVYWDVRARGLGATEIRPAVSCGEENLLGFPGDPYSTESILIHELAHAVHEIALARLDPTFDGRLSEAYDAARSQGLWRGTYAGSNRMEYWAEGAQSWFDANRQNDDQHGPVDTREELRAYDPRLALLLAEVFGDGAWRYVPPRQRSEPAHLAGWDPERAPTFAWPREKKRAYDAYVAARRSLERRPGEGHLQWLRRAAESGDPDYLVRLGLAYRDGTLGPRDDAAAVRCFRAAVASDWTDAYDQLGWMLSQGRGVERDSVEAARLFEIAARRGHRQAQFNLARLLLEGPGPAAPDSEAARAWLERAARRGHGPARELLESL